MDLEAVSEFEETQEEHSQGICSISKHVVVTTDTVKVRYGRTRRTQHHNPSAWCEPRDLQVPRFEFGRL